jgi:hypothetical protein
MGAGFSVLGEGDLGADAVITIPDLGLAGPVIRASRWVWRGFQALAARVGPKKRWLATRRGLRVS